MDNLAEKLTTLLDKIKLKITEQQQKQLVELVLLLFKWNKTYNLTAITDPEEVLIKHIIDSLAIAPYLQGEVFIDVGTGAGFPGLPLAIINPEKKYLLLDSKNKKINFIKTAIRNLNLKNVMPIIGRVEQYQTEIKIDGVISRAFASIDKMLELTEHLIDKKGFFYALKSKKTEKEIEKIDKRFIISKVVPIEIPSLQAERYLVVIKK